MHPLPFARIKQFQAWPSLPGIVESLAPDCASKLGHRTKA